MYIKRQLEQTLQKYLTTKEIIAVVGPRQSGKTTLLRHLFENLQNAIFLDFEDQQTLQLFTQDTSTFIEMYIKKYKYVFIDEFQYALDGGKILKHIYDHHHTKIFISGSSVSGLSIQSLKFLVGRIFVFNLYPLSFNEYIQYTAPELYETILRKELTPTLIDILFPYFTEFCLYGGYPRVVLAKDAEEKEIVLKNIYNIYFLKEIKEILNLPGDHKLAKLIEALAIQTGTIINYNDLCSVTGFQHQDLINYLNIIEKTFICIQSRPFYRNKKTELVKSPKIFFVDNGFRNIITHDFQPLALRNDKGNLYENFIASELLKMGIEVKYWRTKSKAEVDFIIQKNDKLIPVEIKSHLNEPKISKSFHSFLEKYEPKQAYILSEKYLDKKKQVLFYPIFSVANTLK